ncbi:MAG: phosphoribosylamine--glycine ligase [Candidatus Lindowbacteria bacterium RIFCSPLOWO2_12_FULL_62_27]|nr:MAG: phosphoribosylamine--glycine ligase [Candidatus Lindowbacteria bacterium RIFCSPLOWO2_12_FULL_62_27]
MSGSERKKVLVVGKGGREHALVQALRESPSRPDLFVYPGSDALRDIAAPLPVWASADLVAGMTRLGIDLCIIGDESWLADGLADRCKDVGIAVWGPTRNAARLETSKMFAKEFMRRNNIPTAPFSFARSPQEVRALVRSHPVVLKFDGLAAGKGVSVCRTEADVEEFIDRVFQQKQYGQPTGIVVEERLEGKEVSVICAVSGAAYQVFVPARDYKPLMDEDRGPNTGGMGAIASLYLVPEDTMAEIEQSVIRPTLRGIQTEDMSYRGFLYFGLMLTADGPKVLEYNCRFGDPEAEAILPLMYGDIATYLDRAARGPLDKNLIGFNTLCSVCVVLASRFYPYRPSAGEPIEGLAEVKNANVYHSGTRRRPDGGFAVDGGRVIAVTATGRDRDSAVRRAYRAVRRIRFDGMCYRSDIGRLHFEEATVAGAFAA